MLDIVIADEDIDKAFAKSDRDNFFVGVKAEADIYTSTGKIERYTFIYDSQELPWRNTGGDAATSEK
jgi:hypothetical protein